MKRMSIRFHVLALAALLAIVAGCGNEGNGGEAPPPEEHAEQASAPTNRVAIPASVRSNLGITFAEVEQRRIEQTLRAPGRFEYLPTARREYRTMLPGRVELLVDQFQPVEAGEPLYRIESPEWRDMQQQIAEASSAIERLSTKLETFDPLQAAHERHEENLSESIDLWRERIEQLESVREAGGGRISELTGARSSLASARAELASVQEEDAELDAARAETSADLDAARSRRSFLLDSAAAIVGLPRETLTEPGVGEREPRWAAIGAIEVAATESGVVEELGLTNGAWADEKTVVMSVVQPDRLRFNASGLQSDLGVLRDGLEARIVPPTPTKAGRAVPMNETMRGTLGLGLSADPDDRTVDLFVVPEELAGWARAGVSAQLEIVTDSTAAPVLAIPLSAVQRDGLTPVIFRRNPENAGEVIRLEADLGFDDGRWVAVLSGLREGDEVVLDGAFQLMLATSGSMQRGGHFHADGTFHEGDQ